MSKFIIIKGARVNNLKNINVKIPKNKLTVITGLSGSGKSSLAFDTIFAEGQRRYVESLSNYAKQFLGTIPKPEVEHIEGLSPAISIDQKSSIRSPRSTVATMSDIYDYLRLLYAKYGTVNCPKCNNKVKKNVEKNDSNKNQKNINYFCEKCNLEFSKPTISSFSFNSPEGACPDCRGLGKKMVIDIDEIMPNPRLTLAEGAIWPWSRSTSQSKNYQKILENLSKYHKISLNTPIGKLSKRAKEIILYGTRDSDIANPKYFEGVIKNLENKYKNTASSYIKSEIKKYMVEKKCPTCLGARLREESLAIKILGKNIYEIGNLTVSELKKFLEINFLKKISNNQLIIPIIDEVISRLSFIEEVGLSYLTLSRNSTTLSGGEAQRIRLATQLGSYLTGIIYILDEPSIGLHAKDQIQFLKVLNKLRNSENTVIVVEHDRSTMQIADYIIDIGPGAGEYGGRVVEKGTYKELIKSKRSLTAKYLRGEKEISVPKERRQANKQIIIKGAQEHNLKNIDVPIPLNTLTCVTGVSGSGKTSLIFDILAKYLRKKIYKAKTNPGKFRSILGANYIDKVIVVDQQPIGKTPRSNPATYANIFSLIRELYASLEDSKNKRYDSGHFSFNVVGGRCETCKGDGVLKFEMYFLPDAYVVCPACQGKRYNKEILNIYYKPSHVKEGKNIAQILEMTVSEALIFFKDQKLIYHKLKTLDDVGLGYIRLGQSATTLSGGESQRIKLATELARKDTSKTLYILDEPTTGLHFEDINKLLKVLHALVDKGNTVIVVEHNLDIIKNADYIIDLGPVGGKDGGKLIATGAPEAIIKNSKSITGKYLKNVL